MRAGQHLVIVGGGPAGLSAARGYRDAGGEARVTLVMDDDRSPYRRPPLTKEFMRGELDASELFLEEEQWYPQNSIELLHARVLSLDVDRRTVTIEGEPGELRYDACVLATGAAPQRLPVPGADDEDVLLIRSARDAERLVGRARDGVRVALIGTGFIGCEAAASLTSRGALVTLLGMERAPQAERLGPDVGARLAGWLESAGVQLSLGAEVERIERRDGGFRVQQAQRGPVEADMVVMAAGVAARDQLARSAGLRLGSGGRAIAADGALRTTGDCVYAAGDAVEAEHPVAGRPLRVEHWGDALTQGEVAGRRVAGERAVWTEVPGFWSMIGAHTLKYAAWGDGFDGIRFDDHGGDAFSAWYTSDGAVVGVLAHERDEDYERGRELIERGAPPP